MIILLSFAIGLGVGMIGSYNRWSFVKTSVISFFFTGIVSFLYMLTAESAELPVEKLRAATTHIAIGSGFILESPSGKTYLMTNWHVCNSGSYKGVMRASFNDGRLVEGYIVKSDPRVDLCVSKLPKETFGLKVGKSLQVGQKIYTRGYPLHILSETTGRMLGIISWEYIYPIEETGECFKGSTKVRGPQGLLVGCKINYIDNLTNMYTRPGSSGSPVVDYNGDLVGVMNSWDGNNDSGSMVRLEEIQEFVKGL